MCLYKLITINEIHSSNKNENNLYFQLFKTNVLMQKKEKNKFCTNVLFKLCLQRTINAKIQNFRLTLFIFNIFTRVGSSALTEFTISSTSVCLHLQSSYKNHPQRETSKLEGREGIRGIKMMS